MRTSKLALAVLGFGILATVAAAYYSFSSAATLAMILIAGNCPAFSLYIQVLCGAFLPPLAVMIVFATEADRINEQKITTAFLRKLRYG